MNKEFEYKLPNKNCVVETHKTQNNSLIIIGANGSGKSKLGSWIEQEDMEKVHRVGAQRSLNFGEFVKLKSFEQAENFLLYGEEKKETSKNYRWNWGKNFTTQLLNDYENVLAAMIAMKNNQNDDFIKDCKDKEKFNQKYNTVPDSVIDTFIKIWKKIFPQRIVNFDDAKVTATINNPDGTRFSYNGTEMSDGERVGLYLIAQCLCIPKNKTIIIDEPEIHLHRSIMNLLWTELEKERHDCLFIYITHDTQFAANHKQAKKIWTKNYDGKNWEWEEIKESDLPEQLLLDILGNRKKVLFVEGNSDSYDTKLYREIYKDYYVIPCGGCSSVIARTKEMKNTEQLHEIECFGLIDRDFRGEHEINSYKDHNIYTIKVAEVENLFLVEELLTFVNNDLLAKRDETSINRIMQFIIDERFSKEINNQILEATLKELKYQLFLKVRDIPTNDENAAKQLFGDLQKIIDYDKIKMVQHKKFNDILDNKDYAKVLSVFNKKNLINSIASFFTIKNKDEYCDLIIRHLQKDNAKDIINAITPYLPTEIPREIK